MLRVSETELGTAEADWLGCDELLGAPRLDLVGPERLVVVAPHPDDEILGAGGLMRAAQRRGIAVEIVAVTDGEASHPGSAWTGAHLAARRRAESSAALARLGVTDPTVHRLSVPDGGVADYERELAAALRWLLDPSTWCVATWRRDGHPDHDATGRAAADASWSAGARLLEYPIWAWHWATPTDGLPLDRAACLALDSVTQRAKRRAIAEFVSQIRPLGDEPADRVVLPPAVRARFERPFETFLTDGEAP